MEWTTVATTVVGGVIVVVSVCAVQWGSVRRAQVEARVKQDMLARGLSVEEIERLLRPTAPGVASGAASVSRASETALALASAVTSMVEAGKETNEIAAFIDAFLRRQSGSLEPDLGLNDALQPSGPDVAFRQT